MLAVTHRRGNYAIIWGRVCKTLILRVLLIVSSCALAQTSTDSAAPPAPVLPAPKADAAVAPDVPPIEWSARMKQYLKHLVSLDAFGQTVPAAVFDQVLNFPHEWRRDGAGFGDRVGSQYGQFFLGETIQLGFSAFHKEDPRYARLGHGNVLKRTAHALEGAVVASNMHGGQTVALGQIAGVYGSWAIATEWWEPKSEQGVGKIMLWGGVGMGVKAGANIVKEFWPDARKAFIGH